MCVCVCVCVCVCAVTGRAMLDQSAYSTTYVCAGNQRSPALGEGVDAQGGVVEGAGGWGFVWEMVRRICESDAGGGEGAGGEVACRMMLYLCAKGGGYMLSRVLRALLLGRVVGCR